MTTIKQFDKVNLKVIRKDIDADELDGPSAGVANKIHTTLQEMGWSENDLSPAAYIDECGADYISDMTGWLVKSFKYTIENK